MTRHRSCASIQPLISTDRRSQPGQSPSSSNECDAIRPSDRSRSPSVSSTEVARRPIVHNLRYKVLKPAARKAGIPAVAEPRRGFHVLRHTAGSILLEKGWTIAQVSAFLGHANVAITASIYLHAVSMGDIEVLGDALSA